MNKKQRLGLISRILASQKISDQEKLKGRLAKAGLAISQSSLSRDLKALGVQRARLADGSFAYTLPDAPPAASSEEIFKRRFATSVTGVRRSNVIVLVSTPPGEAQLVGRLLDEVPPAGLLGTVAGDDTVLCVARSPKSAIALEKKFKELIQ